MAYESAADETVFVVGPFLVGILASGVAPWLPLVAAGAITLVFVTAFALHPRARSSARTTGTQPRPPRCGTCGTPVS